MVQERVAIFAPPQTPSSSIKASLSSSPWSPGEYSGRFESLRYRLLPALLTRRRFFFAGANRVGLTGAEMLLAAALVSCVLALGFTDITENVALKGDGAVQDSGNAVLYLLAPIFLLVMYRSPLQSSGISLERSMFWHTLFSVAATAFAFLHGYISLYRDKWKTRGVALFSGGGHGKGGEVYWSGAVSVSILALIILTSINAVRRTAPRLWLRSHQVLPVAAAVAFVYHGQTKALIAIACLVLDRLFGYVYQAHVVHKASKTTCVARVVGRDNNHVRLTMPKLFPYAPCQYIGVCVPELGVEWHNFTITTAPSDEDVVLLIKSSGKWTRALAAHVERIAGGPAMDVALPVLVHGPAGSVTLDWTGDCYGAFLIIGGGIGITPMVSLFRLLADQARRGRPLESVRLVYATRDVAQANEVLWMDSERDMERAGALDGFGVTVCVTGSASAPVGVRGTGGFSNVTWEEGRPNFKAIFEEMAVKATAKGIKRVGVLACGPVGLADGVVQNAIDAGSRAVHFDVHIEHFY